MSNLENPKKNRSEELRQLFYASQTEARYNNDGCTHRDDFDDDDADCCCD